MGNGSNGPCGEVPPPTAHRPPPTVTDRLLAAVRTIPDFPSPGIAFKDLTPILADPGLFAEALDRLAAPWLNSGVTHVVGIEARGFWFGPALAARLGVGFVPARKPGKLPAATVQTTYALEYGEDAVELHADAFAGAALAGRDAPRVLVHDDVVATGGTAAAVCALVARLGGRVVGMSLVLEIAALRGRAALPDGVPVEAVLQV